MSYYRRGGHNRTHGCTNDYKCLDSYTFGKMMPVVETGERESVKCRLEWPDGNTVGVTRYISYIIIEYTVDKKEKIADKVYFEKVENNYGGRARYYFSCPYCGERCRYIYLSRQHFKCRKCAKLNYSSQQTTKGCDMAVLKMNKFLRTKFKVTENLAPIEASVYRPERPKGMHKSTYGRLMSELKCLQQAYEQEYNKTAMKIISRAGYDVFGLL